MLLRPVLFLDFLSFPILLIPSIIAIFLIIATLFLVLTRSSQAGPKIKEAIESFEDDVNMDDSMMT